LKSQDRTPSPTLPAPCISLPKLDFFLGKAFLVPLQKLGVSPSFHCNTDKTMGQMPETVFKLPSRRPLFSLVDCVIIAIGLASAGGQKSSVLSFLKTRNLFSRIPLWQPPQWGVESFLQIC